MCEKRILKSFLSVGTSCQPSVPMTFLLFSGVFLREKEVFVCHLYLNKRILVTDAIVASSYCLEFCSEADINHTRVSCCMAFSLLIEDRYCLHFVF